MNKKFTKLLIGTSLIVCVITVGVSAFIIGTVSSEIDKAKKKYSGPQVVGLPSNYIPNKRVAPYIGPHPSQIERQTDPFTFPIRLGEIGPVQPNFTNSELEYPLLCRIERSLLGQPIVDNNERAGMAVYKENPDGSKTGEIVGYSKDCLFKTNAWYYFNIKGTKKFLPLSEQGEYEIQKITVNGKKVDFIVRVELGTINRYLYMVANLANPTDDLSYPSSDLWNNKLIYGFRGGVGIGKRQGRINARSTLRDRHKELSEGYGFAYSTSNQTSTHYNIWLAEDTMARVKKQFSGLYGEPLYTVGVGGSGGAIQQYLIAQNNPELLDAAVTIYSYPDMTTQTIYALDCDLMEYYFDVTANANSQWRDWENRRNVEGLNSLNDKKNPLSKVNALVSLINGKMPNYSSGISECVKSWRGPAQVIHNPKFAHFGPRYSKHIVKSVNWTHWDNLKYFYGTDEYGYGNSTWDNVGVQYGLKSLVDGKLELNDFLHLNQHIGGWKKQKDFDQIRYWHFKGDSSFKDISLWSHHNMNQVSNSYSTIAARTKGHLLAIEAAYRSGHVFLGKAELPIIDLRHYLDDELDMHHSFASFSTRQRMIDYQGHADNQVIWMTKDPHRPIYDAFKVLDKWLLNIKDNPLKSISENKPTKAVHTCFDGDANVIASGDNVWNGEWNSQPPGECERLYPSFESSRSVAGLGIKDDIFKCSLQSVDKALNNGTYGKLALKEHLSALEQIFPHGVCDYNLPDVGRPMDLLNPQKNPKDIVLKVHKSLEVSQPNNT